MLRDGSRGFHRSTLSGIPRKSKGRSAVGIGRGGSVAPEGGLVLMVGDVEIS